MARSIGIEFISVLGLPPVEFVHLAAGLGCDHVGTSLGLEVPQLSLAEAGVDTRTRLSRCVAATRQLLSQVEG